MSQPKKDWAALANSPKFVELQTRKKSFLLSLWCFGTVMFFLLPICAGYAPEMMKIKVFGRLNICYFFCLFEFVVIWGIAIYYTYKSNTYFDPLREEVLSELTEGGLS